MIPKNAINLTVAVVVGALLAEFLTNQTPVGKYIRG